MTRRIVLLLTFSLALALWARRRTKLEVPEGDGVQPVDDYESWRFV